MRVDDMMVQEMF